MEMNSASHPHHWNVTLKDEVLDGLLCTPQIHGSLFDIQQDGLDTGRSDAGKPQPEQ